MDFWLCESCNRHENFCNNIYNLKITIQAAELSPSRIECNLPSNEALTRRFQAHDLRNQVENKRHRP